MSLTSQADAAPIPERDFVEKFHPGLIGSLALHVLAGFFILYQLRALDLPPAPIALPVDLVSLDKPVAEQPDRGAPQAVSVTAPASRAPARPKASTAPVPPAAVVQPTIVNPPAPKPEETLPSPPPDPLQSRLDSLAMLRAPDANGRSTGLSGAAGNGSGSGTYSVRDLIRAQVERRWNLSVASLKGRDITVSIRVVLKSDGRVASAQIVDQGRTETDPLFYTVATSARNAVLLSSPFVLPAGNYEDEFDVTLDLNPRDTLR